MALRSERIVRTFTSDGGGGALGAEEGVKEELLTKLLFPKASIAIYFTTE
jgi:hypothetical protein